MRKGHPLTLCGLIAVFIIFGLNFLLRPYYGDVWSLVISLMIGIIIAFFISLLFDSLREKESAGV